MSTTPRRSRRAFRPTSLGIPLEERVVMSGAPAWTSILRGSAWVPTGASSPQDPSSATGLGDITARQLSTAFSRQFAASRDALQRYIQDQVAVLYSPANLGADGRPTQEAVADFDNDVGGAINATAYGLSSQVALLPGSSRRLIPILQQSLLGDGRGGLAGRIAAQVDSGRGLASRQVLQGAIDRQVGSAFSMSIGQVSSLLRSPGLGRSTVDSAGRPISLTRYVGDQAALQLNNTFGALANSVGANAQASLFDPTGAFNPQGVGPFQQQYGNALNTAAYQANGILSLLPNSSAIRSGLQSGLFGAAGGAVTGTGAINSNLYNALAGALPIATGPASTPFTMDAFNTAFQNGFNSAFQNFNAPIAGLLNPTSTGAQPTTGFFQAGASFPGVFGPQYSGSTYNNGFNNGFAATGTGFPGFGTAPTGFNTSFGTGFNGFINNVNSLSGIAIPSPTGTIGTGSGVGNGNGNGNGTGDAIDPTGGLGGTGTIGAGAGAGVVTGPSPGGTAPGLGGSGGFLSF